MVAVGPRREFSRIGGHRALDLVNTVQWRLSAQRFSDDLDQYDDVVRWVTQTELVSAEDATALTRAARSAPRDAQREVDAVRRLREAVYGVLFLGGDPAFIVEEYRDAIAHGRLILDEGDDAWRFPPDLALPRRRMVLEALDLITRNDLSLLGQCQDADCGWVYLDTSPRHNRRWCVSTDCGNRNRVREHYERTRAASA